MEYILFAIAGIVIGAVTAWLVAKYRFAALRGVPREELESRYILKEIYNETNLRLQEKLTEINTLSADVARKDQENTHLKGKLEDQQKELAKMQETLRIEFENLANRLLEDKSKKFLEINEKHMGELLNPLKEKIGEFQKKVEQTHIENVRDRTSLMKELEQIMKLNQQVSEDANRLTKALKGDSKTQGNWGEIQLELILEKAGLEENIHYVKQGSARDDAGRMFRPDYIINLPDGKNLILDAKVSLTAYDSYFNAEEEGMKQRHLKEHLMSISKHISELGAKNYPRLYGINPPDYVLMFLPVEPALTLALREEIRLFEKALEKNVVLVSVSTLLATLRTISYIWKQENQRRNVVEIARESGRLYDKFVGFVEDLMNIGKKMEEAKGAYDSAMNKLTESTRKGDTIVGRIERIKSLGADTTRSLPRQMLDAALDNDAEEHDSTADQKA